MTSTLRPGGSAKITSGPSSMTGMTTTMPPPSG
jgi:hypothetical protein